MGKKVKDDVSADVSVVEVPELNKKKPNKRKKEISELDSQQKNVRFDCNEAEKDHVKYITTPFLSSVKKEKAKNIKSEEEIKKKKKLSFDEENTSVTKISKKRKLGSDGNKTSDRNIVKESHETPTQQKKSKTESDKSEAPKSEGAVENSATTTEESENAPVSENERTIFVGNLPLTYDHRKIAKLFLKFGPIKSARVRCIPVASANVPKKTTAITKQFNPKRSSANGYVVFKYKESVKKAVAENGMIVDGHHLRIDYVVPKEKSINRSIFVGGLPFDVEDDDLWEAFKDCGEINSVRIVRDNVIGMGKGFGYVNFKSIASVELALKLNGSELRNRKINVQRCIKKKKKKSHEKLSNFKAKKKNKKAKEDNSGEGGKIPGGDFQGRTAEQKKKKKKNKQTTDTLRRNKIKKVLSLSPKKVKKVKSEAATLK